MMNLYSFLSLLKEIIKNINPFNLFESAWYLIGFLCILLFTLLVMAWFQNSKILAIFTEKLNEDDWNNYYEMIFIINSETLKLKLVFTKIGRVCKPDILSKITHA